MLIWSSLKRLLEYNLNSSFIIADDEPVDDEDAFANVQTNKFIALIFKGASYYVGNYIIIAGITRHMLRKVTDGKKKIEIDTVDL